MLDAVNQAIKKGLTYTKEKQIDENGTQSLIKVPEAIKYHLIKKELDKIDYTKQDRIKEGFKFPLPISKKRRWAVKGHIKQNSITEIYGPWGVGKSFYATEITLCRSSGLPFLNAFDENSRTMCLCLFRGLLGYQ